MPSLVQFGAGNIGRGFIAPLFAAAGWSVTFVEADPERVRELERRKAYRVREVGGEGERVGEIGPVACLAAADHAAVAAALAACDLCATAVGLGALPRLAPALAAGLAKRERPLDVLVCENGARAAESLRDAVLGSVPEARRATVAARFGAVRTSIGRMIPPPAPGGDPLDIAVEPYARLPVERAAFRGEIPSVPGLEAMDDFDLVVGQKLYLHNLTHACLAYAGAARGCATIADCMEHRDLVAGARAAGAEAAEALACAHAAGDAARAVLREQCDAVVDDLMARYRNRALNDPVARVARDPARKLGPDDRLVGAARLCLGQGVAPVAIARHIVHACRYVPPADETEAARWADLRAMGTPALLGAVAGIAEKDPLMIEIADAERRLVAAAAMRAVGLVLRDDEVDQLEIADFGLGRFAQFGLAIHVYVNTTRCCAKELMMLPGQICPEHRHPPVDGEPGKEETFRVRSGEVHLFLPGHRREGPERDAALRFLPEDKRDTVTVFKHVHLRAGDQYTLKPNTPHWFAAGSEGAVVSEFSTRSRDEADVFTDPAIRRVPDAA